MSAKRDHVRFVDRLRFAWDGMRGRFDAYYGDIYEEGAVRSPQDLARVLDHGKRNTVGGHVTQESAMRISTVFACVRVITEDIGGLPLNVYKKTGGTGPKGARKIIATDHAVQSLLRQPNEWQTGFEFRGMILAHALLRGNGYAIKLTVRGQTEELIPLVPDRVKVNIHKDGTFDYTVWPLLGGSPATFGPDEIFHLRGISTDGYVGRSVIADARNTIGLGEVQEGYAAEAFRDGGVQRIALIHPGEVSPGARKNIQDSWIEIYGGRGKYSKPAVLEEGMKPEKIGLTAQEMQFLDGRQFSVEDIARFFRVQPHKIGHLARATNNNVESMELDHVISTLRPWARRFEETVSRDLIGDRTESEYLPRHLFQDLLRGDPQKRHQTYAQGRQWGYYSANDVRELEDLNPIDGGDVYLMPINMRDVNAPDSPAPSPLPPSPVQEGLPSNE
jgi:HK97 family phage portal protein